MCDTGLFSDYAIGKFNGAPPEIILGLDDSTGTSSSDSDDPLWDLGFGATRSSTGGHYPTLDDVGPILANLPDDCLLTSDLPSLDKIFDYEDEEAENLAPTLQLDEDIDWSQYINAELPQVSFEDTQLPVEKRDISVPQPSVVTISPRKTRFSGKRTAICTESPERSPLAIEKFQRRVEKHVDYVAYPNVISISPRRTRFAGKRSANYAESPERSPVASKDLEFVIHKHGVVPKRRPNRVPSLATASYPPSRKIPAPVKKLDIVAQKYIVDETKRNNAIKIQSDVIPKIKRELPDVTDDLVDVETLDDEFPILKAEDPFDLLESFEKAVGDGCDINFSRGTPDLSLFPPLEDLPQLDCDEKFSIAPVPVSIKKELLFEEEKVVKPKVGRPRGRPRKIPQNVVKVKEEIIQEELIIKEEVIYDEIEVAAKRPKIVKEVEKVPIKNEKVLSNFAKGGSYVAKGGSNVAKVAPKDAKLAHKGAKVVNNVAVGASNVAKGVNNVANGVSNVTKVVNNVKGVSNVAKGVNNVAKGVNNVAKVANKGANVVNKVTTVVNRTPKVVNRAPSSQQSVASKGVNNAKIVPIKTADKSKVVAGKVSTLLPQSLPKPGASAKPTNVPTRTYLDRLPEGLIARITESSKRKPITVIPAIPNKKRPAPRSKSNASLQHPSKVLKMTQDQSIHVKPALQHASKVLKMTQTQSIHMDPALQHPGKVLKMTQTQSIHMNPALQHPGKVLAMTKGKEVHVDHCYCTNDNLVAVQEQPATEPKKEPAKSPHSKEPKRDSGFQSAEDSDSNSVLRNQPRVTTADGKVMVSLLKINSLPPVDQKPPPQPQPVVPQKKKLDLTEYKKRYNLKSNNTSSSNSPITSNSNSPLPEPENLKRKRMFKEMVEMAEKEVLKAFSKIPEVKLEQPAPVVEERKIVLPPGLEMKRMVSVGVNTVVKFQNEDMKTAETVTTIVNAVGGKITPNSLMATMIRNVPKKNSMRTLDMDLDADDNTYVRENLVIRYLEKDRPAVKTRYAASQTYLCLMPEIQQGRYRRRNDSSSSDSSSVPYSSRSNSSSNSRSSSPATVVTNSRNHQARSRHSPKPNQSDSRRDSQSRSRSRSNSRPTSRTNFEAERTYSRPTSRTNFENERTYSRPISRTNFETERNDAERYAESQDRRVLYIGGISKDTTQQQLKTRFDRFGEITNVKLHFRDYGDNYAFITFRKKEDAYTAVDKGNYTEPHYHLSFGGRRIFCGRTYADLDNVSNQYDNYTIPSRSSVDRAWDKLLCEYKEIKGIVSPIKRS